jgi:hypothetical protein
MSRTIDEQINTWIRNAGTVLSNPGARIMLTVIELPSELAYARFFARTSAAGLTVIPSRPASPSTFPQTLHLLTLKSSNEMAFCGASLDTSEMTPKAFIAEIAKAERGMPIGRPINLNLAISSNNVKAMAEQVAVLVECYGDRFKASRLPSVPMDDAREVTWLMSIANAEQHAAVTSRCQIKTELAVPEAVSTTAAAAAATTPKAEANVALP